LSALDRFLELLERPDVVELSLCTGAEAAVRMVDGLHSITQRPLRASDLLSLVAGSPLETVIRETPGDIDQVLVYGSRRLHLKVKRAAADLQLSISLVTDGARLRMDAHGSVPHPNSPELQNRAATSVVEHSAATPRAVEGGWRSGMSLTDILEQARRQNVSAVHFFSDQPIRMRKVGRLTPFGEVISHHWLTQAMGQLLNAAQQTVLTEHGYVDFSYQERTAGRLRVNVCRQRTGLKACLRLIPDKIPTLSELGLPPELAKVQDYHQGLIVISGPNGHGKTTTLAALVDLFNQTRPAHIITVEDPVEFIHSPKRAVVSQREVGVHTRSFETALKGALREDPDIIAIGELRDRETVEMALTASETGHVVLATMSTPNGASTIERLIDMFAPEDQSQVRATLAGALKLVISQRLVPVRDGSRHVAAAELITGNVPLWTLIRDNKLYQLPSLLQRGRGYGMIRVEDSLNDLLERGLIDEETARAFADEPKNIAGAGKQGGAVPVQNPANAPGMMGMFRKKS
jgi:twitching motility protein PilT